MGETVKTTDVAKDDIKWLWPLIEPYLNEALERSLGLYDIVDVFNGLMDETMRLWITYDMTGDVKGVAVCMIHAFPRRRTANILLMAGKDLAVWSENIHCIEDWAKQNGADLLTAYTRPGVAKEMKPHGFKTVHHVIGKVLTIPTCLH